MPSDDLFEDRTPEDEIFGNGENLIPRNLAPATEAQKLDPLRKPKVKLSTLLVAEKEALTVKQIEARMLNDDGVLMDPMQYGFATLDDLLQACPDYIVHRRRHDGVHTYCAKNNEALLDIAEMVQLQKDRNEVRRAPRSFFGRPTDNGVHGSSFRAYRGPACPPSAGPVGNQSNKGNVAQLQARKELGPMKTLARVRNVLDVIRKYRSEIGISHPQHPQKIVSLAAVQAKFNQIYGLPVWGKPMEERELEAALSQPQFAGVLKFFTTRADGDIYVDEGNGDVVGSELETPAQNPESNELDYEFEGFSSINDETPHHSLLSDAAAGETSHFEQGPGFSENVADKSLRLSDLAVKFGVSKFRNPYVAEAGDKSLQAGSQHTTFNDEMSSLMEASMAVVEPMITFDPAFEGRAITPVNGLEMLVTYVKSRGGKVDFETLPIGDKRLINTNKTLFSLTTTHPGELFVQLVNPKIDPLMALDTNTLRDPVENDVRWLSKVLVNTKGRCITKPIAFVAPRGFILMTYQKEHADEKNSKISLMGSLLRKSMQDPVKDLERDEALPGAAAVLLYREPHSVTVSYFRVLIMGSAANGNGDISVLLADAEDQHFVDTPLTQLFPMPEKAGFHLYPPNIVFASVYGIFGLSQSEQDNLRKNFDDENRKRFAVTVFRGDQEREEMLSADMLFTNESGELEWLSQILKRRGATMTADTDSTHLSKDLQTAVLRMEEQPCVMDFIDFRRQQGANTVVEKPLRQASPPSNPAPSPIETDRSDLSALYKLFKTGLDANDSVLVVSMAQWVARAVEKQHATAPEWTELLEHMRVHAEKNGYGL